MPHRIQTFTVEVTAPERLFPGTIEDVVIHDVARASDCPASADDDPISEAVAFLDEMAAQGCYVRFYPDGHAGLTVPESWDDEEFNVLALEVEKRDAVLRRLIPCQPGAAPLSVAAPSQFCGCGECEECIMRQVLIEWGQERGWPRLLMRPWWAIPAGEEHWRVFAAKHGTTDLRQSLAAID